MQEAVPVFPDDTVETLSARVLEVEHRILPESVALFCEDRLVLRGRTVHIPVSYTHLLCCFTVPSGKT